MEGIHMNSIAKRLCATLALVAVPLFSDADQGEQHKAVKKAESAEHAAALGQPGKAADATLTVEVTVTAAMHFVPAAIAVKKATTIRIVVSNGAHENTK